LPTPEWKSFRDQNVGRAFYECGEEQVPAILFPHLADRFTRDIDKVVEAISANMKWR
jgi:hypothetical protein